MRFGNAGVCDGATQLGGIVKDLKGAVLLVDSVTSQLIHWWVGEGKWLCDPIRILDMGDHDVLQKSKAIKSAERVVVLSGLLLRGQRLQVVQGVLSRLCASSPLCSACTVYCTLPSSAHAAVVAGYDVGAGTGSGVGDESPFDVLASQLRLLMNKVRRQQKATAEIVYLPAVLAPVGSDVFFTPAHSTLQPLLTTDVPRINALLKAQNDQRQTAALSTLDINMLPDAVRQHLKCVSHNFSELFRSLSVQEHCFSLGPTSRLVAAELAALPEARTRHKVATSTASVLFVDRSLDLATPMSCNSETVADTIRASLAPLPGHDVDVAVDMSPLLDIHSSCRHCVAPGCLAHPGVATAHNLLSSFVGRKPKDALTELSRRLVEAIAEEKLPMDARRVSSISPSLLSSLLKKFRCKPGAIARHSALLQMAVAATSAMESETTSRLQHALSVEKVVLLTLAEEGFSAALDQLLSHLRGALEGGESLGACGYLRLLITLYSAAGTAALSISSECQALLQTSLEKLILVACSAKDDAIIDLVGDHHNKDSIRLFLRNFFTQLTGIADARSHMKMFRTVHSGSSGSLLQQVAQALAAPDKPDLPDIEHHSQYMRNLIKTGFSLFMGGSKPRPSDHSLLIIYVLGGLSCSEAKSIRDQFSSARSDIQVVVGGTRLTTATSLLRQVCCCDSLDEVPI